MHKNGQAWAVFNLGGHLKNVVLMMWDADKTTRHAATVNDVRLACLIQKQLAKQLTIVQMDAKTLPLAIYRHHIMLEREKTEDVRRKKRNRKAVNDTNCDWRDEEANQPAAVKRCISGEIICHPTVRCALTQTFTHSEALYSHILFTKWPNDCSIFFRTRRWQTDSSWWSGDNFITNKFINSIEYRI